MVLSREVHYLAFRKLDPGVGVLEPANSEVGTLRPSGILSSGITEIAGLMTYGIPSGYAELFGYGIGLPPGSIHVQSPLSCQSLRPSHQDHQLSYPLWLIPCPYSQSHSNSITASTIEFSNFPAYHCWFCHIHLCANHRFG